MCSDITCVDINRKYYIGFCSVKNLVIALRESRCKWLWKMSCEHFVTLFLHRNSRVLKNYH